MNDLDDRPPSAEPPSWWWQLDRRPAGLSLEDLVDNGTLDREVAGLLWRTVEEGRSVTIAAPDSGAGKSTLLAALLPAIPASRTIHFVRGIHDNLESVCSPSITTLIADEISPFLPAYCWGRSLRLMLEAGSAGCQILTTIHADSIEGIVQTLSARPQSFSLAHIARLGTVAILERTHEGARTLRSAAQMRPDENGDAISLTTLVECGRIVR